MLRESMPGCQLLLDLFGRKTPSREPERADPAPATRGLRATGPEPGTNGQQRQDGMVPGANALTRQARASVARLGLKKLAGGVVVRWNRRLRSTAGRADYYTSVIELNPELGKLDNAIHEIERTLMHELAHLVAHSRARGRRIADHGPEWRRACADLGIPGEARTHTLELAPQRKVRRRFAYRCPACGSVLLRVRRLYRHSACYACCRRHSGGQYDPRFQLFPVPVELAERTIAASENGGP